MNKKYLHLLILIYLIGYVLCKFYFAEGMLMESYTAGWLFRRSFIFTWVIVIPLLWYIAHMVYGVILVFNNRISFGQNENKESIAYRFSRTNRLISIFSTH